MDAKLYLPLTRRTPFTNWLDPDFEGCCFSWLAYRLQTCLTAQALPENETAARSRGFLAPRFPYPKRWSVVKKGWELNGFAISISRVYLTFASFHGTEETMQLTSWIGAKKTRVESTQPEDAQTRKQRRDKPCKPSSLPGLRLEDIQAMRRVPRPNFFFFNFC